MAPCDGPLSRGSPKLRYIRYFGWSGGIVGYLAMAVYRYQMPHLAKTVHMNEVVFGRVATALSLALAAAFFVTGRWSGWHGKSRWIFLPQLALAGVSGTADLGDDGMDDDAADACGRLCDRTAVH